MKRRVAIIGVTGSVGQEFVQSLNGHPWFEVTQIAASDRSAGKMYLDAIRDSRWNSSMGCWWRNSRIYQKYESSKSRKKSMLKN